MKGAFKAAGFTQTDNIDMKQEKGLVLIGILVTISDQLSSLEKDPIETIERQ